MYLHVFQKVVVHPFNHVVGNESSFNEVTIIFVKLPFFQSQSSRILVAVVVQSVDKFGSVQRVGFGRFQGGVCCGE